MKYVYAGILSTIFATFPAAAKPSPAALLPAPQTRGEVTWLSGGVGRDEARAFQREASRYPLEVVFVQKSGKRDEYLANVPVTIRDAKHHVVLDGVAQGPYLLARLPAGDYEVSARWESWHFGRHVKVGAGHQRVVFEWKKDDAKRHA